MYSFGEGFLVFGEVLFDEFGDTRKLGGAPFNVAYNLLMLGFNPSLLSRVGQDNSGDEILRFMKKKGLSADLVGVDAVHETGRVCVTVKNGEPDYEIKKDQAYDYIGLPAVVPDAGCVCYGTLAARSEISRNTLLHILKTASGMKFYDVNLRKDCWTVPIVKTLMQCADFVKLNADELRTISEQLAGRSSGRCEDALMLAEMFDLKGIFVTFGAEGAGYYSPKETCLCSSAELTDIADTVGAGDAFSAVVSAGIISGEPVEKILKKAVLYAAGICRLNGALAEDDAFYADLNKEVSNVFG